MLGAEARLRRHDEDEAHHSFMLDDGGRWRAEEGDGRRRGRGGHGSAKAASGRGLRLGKETAAARKGAGARVAPPL